MRPVRISSAAALIVGLSFATPSQPVRAASHLWRFNEIFSNASGTVQFIELKECCGADEEIFLTEKWVECTFAGNRITFDHDLLPPTTNKYLLLATTGFAALPGAPTPDFIIADGFLPFGGDTLQYWFYGPAFMTYGAGELPTNGILSLNINGSTGVNSPTNFAGQGGSVNAACIDLDGDGYGNPGDPTCPAGSQTDCNDGNNAINPAATEVCTDSADNDCDGLTDCDDPPCAAVIPCIPTLSEWGMLAMMLSLFAAGSVLLSPRRCRAPAPNA